MPSFEAEIDAHFYELIHKLVNSDSAEDQPDRRVHARERFSSIHKVASYDGSTPPQAREFVDVCCHDLSRGGFSYLASFRPASESLVTAFGVPPDVTCMEARVVGAANVLQFPSTNSLERRDERADSAQRRGPNGELGIPMVLVRCQFVRRLKDTEEISWT